MKNWTTAMVKVDQYLRRNLTPSDYKAIPDVTRGVLFTLRSYEMILTVEEAAVEINLDPNYVSTVVGFYQDANSVVGDKGLTRELEEYREILKKLREGRYGLRKIGEAIVRESQEGGAEAEEDGDSGDDEDNG